MSAATNQNKVLTVSVAAYNVEEFLSDALESCIVPNMDELEVIVVNDGSSDKTLDIARGFAQQYPDTFRVVNKPNGGYGSTINSSLSLASGKYFRYLDGDDWFDSSVLSSCIEALQQCETDCVVTPYRRVYEDGSPSVVRDCVSYLPAGHFQVTELDPRSPIAACALAYRTELLRSSNYHMSEHCFYTDIEFAYLPMVAVESVDVLKQPLYQYRIGREGQSVSAEGIRRHYKDLINVCIKLVNQLVGVDCASSEYIDSCLVKECCTVYKYLCLAGPDVKVKQDLQSFDKSIHHMSPALYSAMAKRSKRVRLLRTTRFAIWKLACKVAQRDA